MTTINNENGTFTVYSEVNNETYVCDATTEQEAIDSYNAYRDAIPLKEAKQSKLNEFKKWLKEQKNRTYYFNLSTTKAINTKLSADVISLKESLDDVAIDNDYDNATRNSMTTDLWYNADQTQVDITYLELIEIRIEIAKIKTDLLRREKIISAYINAQTTVQAVEGITNFGTIDISGILQLMQGGA